MRNRALIGTAECHADAGVDDDAVAPSLGRDLRNLLQRFRHGPIQVVLVVAIGRRHGHRDVANARLAGAIQAAAIGDQHTQPVDAVLQRFQHRFRVG